ncbi:response regulator [Magnetococcales bacterium HHB-1]
MICFGVSITYENDDSIQILDVEKILGEIVGVDESLSDELLEEGRRLNTADHVVMIVDDSKAARELLIKTLDQFSIRYVTADNAAKAMELLQQSIQPDGKRYTMIISDIEMPGMDGFTFARKVKSHPKLSDTFLVLHSSMSNPSNRLKAQQVGADDFVPKFKPEQIASLVISRIRKAEEGF